MASNPLLSDPEVVRRFQRLPEPAQAALKDFVGWLYQHAREKAEASWRRSKAPMAVYWKAVAAWSYHIRRIL